MKYTLPVIFALAATTVAVPTAGGYGESCNRFPGHRDFDGHGHGRKDFGDYRGHNDFDRHGHKGFGGKKGLIDVDIDVDINGHKKGGHFDKDHHKGFGGKKGLVNVDVDVDVNGRKKGGHFDNRKGHFDGKDFHHGRFDGHDHRKGRFDGPGFHKGHGGRFRKCAYPTFVDEQSLVVDVDINVLGLLNVDLDIDIDLDINRVRQRYPKCKAFYCCNNRYLKGKRMGNGCSRFGRY